MSDMKCPVCNVGYVHESVNHWCCDYEFCPSYNETDTETYDILIRTRKALEWARHFLKEIRLRYLLEKDNPSRQNKWADTALYMYNCAESFFDDYDKTNETKGCDND